MSKTGLSTIAVLSLAALAAGCSNTSLTPPPAGSAMLGGTVSGLQGTGLVLANSDGTVLPVNSGTTAFTFPQALTVGTKYSVSVKSQPGNPTQMCKVANGSGTLDSTKAASVSVSCSTSTETPTYRISGTVSGLLGHGLILTSSNGGATVVSGNGNFRLPQPVADGSDYDVVVAVAPNSAAQGCSISNGVGTISGASITNVSVRCANATEELIISDGQGKSAAYFIDPSTGIPAPSGVSTGLAATGPMGVADPSGKYLFVSNVSGASVSAYTMSAATGAPMAVMGSPFAAPPLSTAPVIDPTGKFLYAGGSAGAAAFTIDPTSGLLTPVAAAPFPGRAGGASPGAVGCACLASAKFLYYAQDLGAGSFSVANFGIDASTGALNAAAASGASSTGEAHLAADPSGKLFFLLAAGTVQSYVVNGATGALGAPVTTQGPDAATQLAHGIVVDPSGKFAYVLSEPGGTINAYSVDPASGALTPLSPATVVTGVGPQQIRFDLTGRYLYVTSTTPAAIWAYAFDSGTGTLAPAGSGMVVTSVVPSGLAVTSLQ